MRIRAASFHSVKGGVGKSSLATAAAVQIARRKPELPVYLIDMDLTGTSLADVLPIMAPQWSGVEQLRRKTLEKRPDTRFSVADTKAQIVARASSMRDRKAASPELHVPFLNDFLLHQPSDDERSRDVDLESLCWRLDRGPRNLEIIPSSAIPGDLDRIVPVIFDEQHAAFLETRLEALVAMIASRPEQDVLVIVDVPPTIPGLSRSVMSLALRLSKETKQPLAVGGTVKAPLEQTVMDWTIHLVTSPDPQDLGAIERWLTLVQPDELECFRVVINRHRWPTARDERENLLSMRLGLAPQPGDAAGRWLGGFEPFISKALYVEHRPDMEFFQTRSTPAVDIDFGLVL